MPDNHPILDTADGGFRAPSTTFPISMNESATYSIRAEAETKTRGQQEFEEYDEDDARTMSPRRSIAEIEEMGREAKALLEEYV